MEARLSIWVGSLRQDRWHTIPPGRDFTSPSLVLAGALAEASYYYIAAAVKMVGFVNTNVGATANAKVRAITEVSSRDYTPSQIAARAKIDNQESSMTLPEQNFMLRLREALEASWGRDTSYLAAEQAGNPALGQCYPTSRVVQHYFPETEIIKGKVQTGGSREDTHFWNALRYKDHWYHIDLSWQQFPPGARVSEFVALDRHNLGDSPPTIQRCELLLSRVEKYLSTHQ